MYSFINFCYFFYHFLDTCIPLFILVIFFIILLIHVFLYSFFKIFFFIIFLIHVFLYSLLLFFKIIFLIHVFLYSMSLFFYHFIDTSIPLFILVIYKEVVVRLRSREFTCSRSEASISRRHELYRNKLY